MSFFQFEGFIREKRVVEESTKTMKEEFKFEMEIPDVSMTSSDLFIEDNRPKYALTWRQWTWSSMCIIALVVGGPLTLALLYRFYVVPAVYELFADLSEACDTDPLWSTWDTLFQVNIRSGNISFTASKIIDIAWDIVIGRGGQFLLARISYRVYTDLMTYLVEREAIDPDLFATTMLYGQSIWTLWYATRSLFTGMSRRAVWILLWMTASMLYVLVFPTLLSACTSYVVASHPAVLLDDNTTVPVTTYLESASYALTNHGIEGKPSPWYINIANVSTIPTTLATRNMVWLTGREWSIEGTDLTINGESYTIRNTTITSCGFYYKDHFYDKTSTISQHNDNLSLLPNSQTICQPDSKNYLWGASFELLIILLLAQSLWAIGMWIAWILANQRSVLVRHRGKMGQWRAVLDIAKPLNDTHIDSKLLMSNRELKQVLAQRGPLKYSIERAIDDEIFAVSLFEI